MNIRVLLFTAGIAAVQVGVLKQMIAVVVDCRQQPAGSWGGIRQNAGRVPRTGQSRNEMPVGLPRNANPFGGTSRGIFYSGQFPYGYSLWSRGA